jgi:predicted kinase
LSGSAGGSPHPAPVLVVFGGLPGVGKTTLSREVARALWAVWLRIDAIEAAIWEGRPSEDVGAAGYNAAAAVAGANLSLGWTVVVDAVNPLEVARRPWRELAALNGVPLRVVEVLCSDPAEHRRRVERREPDIEGFAVPTWQQVLDREYEPWTEPRLTVDTCGDAGDGLRLVVDYLVSATKGPGTAPVVSGSGDQALEGGEGEAGQYVEADVPRQSDHGRGHQRA